MRRGSMLSDASMNLGDGLTFHPKTLLPWIIQPPFRCEITRLHWHLFVVIAGGEAEYPWPNLLTASFCIRTHTDTSLSFLEVSTLHFVYISYILALLAG